MAAPLFPVKKDQKATEEPTPDWLSVGQSFAPPKPPDTRMKAEDFFGDSDDEISESKKPEKRQRKRKHKKLERRLQKMLVEVVAQESSSLLPASEILSSEALVSMAAGRSEEDIAASLISSDVAGKLHQLELKRQIDKAQNLKPIFIDKDLPPITYDTIRRESYSLYGSFSMQEVPVYARGVGDRILGLEDSGESRQLMKELNEMLGIYADAKPRPKRLRYFSKRVAGLPSADESEYKPRSAVVTTEGFIPFMRRGTVKEETKKEIGDFEFDPSQANEEERSYLEKTKQFNEKLRSEPKNVKVWLEYIDLQDELMKTKYEKQKIERKLTIIEKALNSVEPGQKIELILLFMKASRNIDKLQEKFEAKIELWKKYLQQYPLSYKLITGYINFLLEEKNVSITNMRTLILEAITIIRASADPSEQAKTEKLVINVLVEACRLEKYVAYYYIIEWIQGARFDHSDIFARDQLVEATAAKLCLCCSSSQLRRF
eukprot:TRINITY_DN10700_c0_g1_i1.p1 TRINITY_DN10700_c0_g1~~TRINITY_DN10700_c0_g1_i1.p1  ORF type:complete len:489 (-),score=112.20 TRINITY_DN10700_c0_g1_i1:144-1610(-)